MSVRRFSKARVEPLRSGGSQVWIRVPVWMRCAGIAATLVVLFSVWRGWHRQGEPSWQGRNAMQWLESCLDNSFQSGRPDGYSAVWLDPTTELMEAFQRMGNEALPILVDVGLGPETESVAWTALKELDGRAPWLTSKFPRRIETWASRKQGISGLARAVISELRPGAADLVPWLTNRLSNPRSLLMLGEVSEEREAAATLIGEQNKADGSIVVSSLELLGSAGVAAKPALVEYLKTNHPAGRQAFRCLCNLGPGAEECLPQLRAFFDRQGTAAIRISLAFHVAAVDPGPFWAESELRAELLSAEDARVGIALRQLLDCPLLITSFEPELHQLAMTGRGRFDPFDVWKRRQLEWQQWYLSPRASPAVQGGSTPPLDLAGRACSLLEGHTLGCPSNKAGQ